MHFFWSNKTHALSCVLLQVRLIVLQPSFFSIKVSKTLHYIKCKSLFCLCTSFCLSKFKHYLQYFTQNLFEKENVNIFSNLILITLYNRALNNDENKKISAMVPKKLKEWRGMKKIKMLLENSFQNLFFVWFRKVQIYIPILRKIIILVNMNLIEV